MSKLSAIHCLIFISNKITPADLIFFYCILQWIVVGPNVTNSVIDVDKLCSVHRNVNSIKASLFQLHSFEAK